MWEAVRDGLVALYPQARIETHGMRFVLEFEGTRVGVYVLPTTSHLLAILADIGTLGSLEPVQALEWNGVLTNEALAIVDNTFVVRAFVDPNTPLTKIEARIQSTARVGAMIKAGTLRPHQPSVFAHFAQ